MDDKLKVIPSSALSSGIPQQYTQTGNDNLIVPNYGNLTLNVNQQLPMTPMMGGGFYIPPAIDREYYNLFVVGIEEFDKPFFKIPRDRVLNEYMSKETRALFETWTPEVIARIKNLPSLFMAENGDYGIARDGQAAIYGFVYDLKIYENDIKVYYCSFLPHIPQQRINDLHEELGIPANKGYSELNRTHWAIKRVDLIQELLEAGVQIPVFNMQR